MQFGGRPGVREVSTLQAAIARPYNGYFRKIEEKAAALVDSVARYHAFADGNKRTSLILLLLLLDRSGYRLVGLGGEDIDQSVEDMIVDLVERRIDLAAATKWLKPRIRRS